MSRPAERKFRAASATMVGLGKVSMRESIRLPNSGSSFSIREVNATWARRCLALWTICLPKLLTSDNES